MKEKLQKKFKMKNKPKLTKKQRELLIEGYKEMAEESLRI